jgi:hypothetical protein
MDDLAFVRERIESYADYTNDDERRLADEQVRAYVGEALARLFERLEPSGTAAEMLAGVLLRCQFADQTVVRAMDTSGDVSPSELTALHASDRDLIALADRGDSIDAAGLEAYLTAIDAGLDKRAHIVLAGAAATPPLPPR